MANLRKIAYKALCAVLQRWLYNCMDRIKSAVNACVWLYATGQNKSPAPSADARQKKSPAISDRVECFLFTGLKECAKKPEEEQDTG